MKPLLLAALLLPCACDDFTLEPRFVNEPPVFSVFLTVDHSDSSLYLLGGSFRAGVDSAGISNGVRDSTMYVQGVAVPPADVSRSTWRYEWSQRRAVPATVDTLWVRSPLVDLASGANPLVAIPIATRGDPMNITMAPGEDLRLHVISAPVKTGGGPPPFERWDLTVLREGAFGSVTLVTITGYGPTPAELQVPAQWLQSSATLLAILHVVTSTRLATNPFDINAVVNVQIAWRVTPLSPAA